MENNNQDQRRNEQDEFFAAPFVEQQVDEQNAQQVNEETSETAMEEPLKEPQSNAEEAPVDALPMFAPDMDNRIEPRSDDNDFRDDEFNEEFSAEVATMENANLAETNDEAGAQRSNATWGWAGLIMAIASLFIWPVLLGPAAAVAGFIALTQGHRALGIWSIVIGLISFMAYIVLVPLYA